MRLAINNVSAPQDFSGGKGELRHGIDQLFNEQALAQGFQNLKGHRSVGGMRASLYNAFSYEGVEALVTFMKAFEAENGGEK